MGARDKYGIKSSLDLESSKQFRFSFRAIKDSTMIRLIDMAKLKRKVKGSGKKLARIE